MKRVSVMLILFLILATMPAFAADSVLAYFENNSGNLRLTAPGGVIVKGADLKPGLKLGPGTSVVTEKKDLIEIALGNGSILKIQENTSFTIVSLRGANNSKTSAFELQKGRFRTIAAKMSGDEKLTFKTPNAACGVRGTDTGAEVLTDPATDAPLPAQIFVFDGVVDVSKLDAAGQVLETIAVGAGQWVDSGLEAFKALVMDKALIEKFMKGLEFKQLDPAQVPGHVKADVTSTGPDTATGPEPGPAPEPDWMKTLRDIIGMEIGAVTIGDRTYAKAVLAPKFTIGKLKLSLYLPIIYQSNLFDPSDWYRPDGNQEWSFGTDREFGDNWWLRAGDFAYDLVLKIKGLEYGRQHDPFFIRLGSLNTFTIGHGLIMRNYANDSDFPAVRRVGLNLGVDTGPFGFEIVTNDIGLDIKAEPEIAGLRLYFRPAHPFPLAIGLTLLADFDPAGNAPGVGDPMFFNLGLDLDFPIVESDGLSIIAFADAAVMLPYFREDVPGSTVIPAGFAFDAIIHGPDGDKAFRNFGAAAGLLGNVSLFEWRLEARYYTGKFRPTAYNAAYDRVKLDYVNELIDYLRNPGDDANQVTTFGVYGEGVLSIEKIFSLTLGYFAPLAFSPDGVAYGEDDYFQIKFTLEPKVIPVVGIFGSIAYERTGLVSGFSGGLPELFDEHTVVKTTIGYPVTEGLQILFHYTTTRALDPGAGTYHLVHAFTFETVIDF
jgi:hypothetical protein